MYHLYSGSGTVRDTSGATRRIHGTMMISDQLETWISGGPGQPVQVIPGQPIPNEQYQFRISHWYMAVDRIGIFFGQSGSIYLEFLSPHFNDKMFFLNSDASVEYDWAGEIEGMHQPDDWVNPTAPDYGHLPHKIKCAGIDMGQTIAKIFTSPPNIVLTHV